MKRTRTFLAAAFIACAGLAAAAPLVTHSRAGVAVSKDAGSPPPLVTGKRLTPQGQQTDIGSYPDNLVLSPNGKYLLVTNTGFREYVSVLRASDGTLVSRLDFNAPSSVLAKTKEALYYGLACGKTENGLTTVYASRGGEGLVSVLTLDGDGRLTDAGKPLGLAAGDAPAPPFLAGLAVSGDGQRLYAADNSGDPKEGMRGALWLLDAATGAHPIKVSVPGYPFAVCAVTAGPDSGRKIYVTSEQRGTVSVVDPGSGKALREIATGAQPISLRLDRAQARLFVANAGSDTVSIVDTRTDHVTRTLLLRPDTMRGLPGATPMGLALSPDEKRLYVPLADMNAVAVVSLPAGRLAGYIPVGWYPTAAVVSPDGARLFVANAKGVAVRNPNAKPRPGLTERPQYIQNIIEGTVATIALNALPPLKTLTAQTLANNMLANNMLANNARQPGQGRTLPKNPGIKHVFYIIKENRTYDQVLGDEARGNGDPSLVLFGQEVTPNLHRLAERFALLDNFYCCAEVSGDGWNWSTAGMASEYTARNVPHNYSGRERAYDFEGTNNGLAVDRVGIPDAARPPGGYLWDDCGAHGVSLRNYGFFTDDLELPRTLAEQGTEGLENSPTKRALLGKSDSDFRQFDLTYADSEAWIKAGLPPAPKQRSAYGSHKDPSRVTAWKREFAGYVRAGNLPALSLIRLMRDHTSGTTAGASSPRAMAADNDYAVGQVVETLSHSPFWKSSVVVVVEDDAQNGYDHVDAHRSTCYVISPFVDRATHDSRFYNTDSALHTIEALLGLPPMNQYDAIAPPFAFFSPAAANAAPYDAVLPDRTILAEVNTSRAYRSRDSARLLNTRREESGPDEQLNDILWRSIKGSVPPPRHYSLSAPRIQNGDSD